MFLFLNVKNCFYEFEHINDVICAKFSNSVIDANNILLKIIKTQMIYEFCKSVTLILLCIQFDKYNNSMCKKKFFKIFQKIIFVSKNQYLFY